MSSLVPQVNGTGGKKGGADAGSFNASKGELKLGPAPLEDALRSETDRVLREQALSFMDREANGADSYYNRTQTPSAGLVAPTQADLLPRPPTFKTVDVKREVEKVRDARKRIRLDPSAIAFDKDAHNSQAARARALPSICAYTLHDASEGYVHMSIHLPL